MIADRLPGDASAAPMNGVERPAMPRVRDARSVAEQPACIEN
jgi:hypothetical protein